MSLDLTANPEDLRKHLFELRTRGDVAKMLDVGEDRLIYHLYIVPPHGRYETFEIPKKSGGTRDIAAPATALKILQRKLNQVLQQVYQPKASVHGFVSQKSILTNARPHSRQKYVLNIDLENFFPSINFGRVRGMFMAVPYGLNKEVSTILAQICCFNNQLPQGAPTSPIVSNMLCAKMDSQLLRLAEKYRCIYTRYADDITLSTSMPQFPPALARISERTGQIELGDELANIIRANGFKPNAKKVRLQIRNRRQEVTGLTVNKFPNVERQYVRQIRAMLHAWEKFGLEAAENEFLTKYRKKHRHPNHPAPLFKQVVKEKIEFLGMIRGKTDGIYLKFRNKLGDLAPDLASAKAEEVKSGTLVKPWIITEGKTDWKHLKSALLKLQKQGLFQSLEIEFFEYGDETKMGDVELLTMCRTYSKTSQEKLCVFIFDRDNSKIINDVSLGGSNYRSWRNNVFSFAIPVPSHRADNPDVCIEMCYQDSEITRKDSAGRRLFLSREFSQRSGRHVAEDLTCSELNRVRRSVLSIIDDQVLKAKEEKVALSKIDFAD
jgi:RNA-directed DNA polymerase